MSNTIDSVSHLKNRILLATYIFRSLPVEYLHKTAEEANERQKVRNTLVHLKRDQYILQKKALHGAQFMYLTKRGYMYINSKILKVKDKQPLYVQKRYHTLRKSISEHSFMNFMFIWHYILTNPKQITADTKIYEDSNMNQCKIPTYYGGRDVVVAPDTVILLPDPTSSIFQKALFVENDTGRETYKQIYHKLVEYAVLAESGLAKNKLNEFTLYFIVPTKKRLQQLFYNPAGIISFFASYNNTRQVKDIRARTIVSSFSNPKITIYVSAFNPDNPKNPYVFEKYPLVELLLKEKPEWKVYLP